MNGPILFTERLILRPAAAEDFEGWAAFHADEETMRHLGSVLARKLDRAIADRPGCRRRTT